MSPRAFAEHLDVVRRYASPQPLRRMVRRLRDGTGERRSVAVTFDDGYADTLHVAKPLLDRHDLPATIFVTTGALEQPGEFWWDVLARILLGRGPLPPGLRLQIAGRLFQWDLRETAGYDDDTQRRADRWRYDDPPGADPTVRQACYRALYAVLRRASASEQRRALHELECWAGGPERAAGEARALTPDELLRLAGGGQVEVGTHTVTHAALATLPPWAQRVEIRESKTHLESLLGCRVTGLAYPYGSRRDYSSGTIDILKESRLEYACSASSDCVRRATDPFRLPRLVVGDWDGETLLRTLHQLGVC